MAVEQEARAPSKAVHKPYMENRSLTRESPDSQLRLSLTGTAHADDSATLPTTPTMAGKRKQPELNSAGRFRVVSQMVIAMRRFQASLNPTYTFGKRSDSASSGQSSGWVKDSPERSPQRESTGSPQQTSHRPAQPHPVDNSDAHKPLYNSRGNKASYLLRPLPPADSEARWKAQHSDGL